MTEEKFNSIVTELVRVLATEKCTVEEAEQALHAAKRQIMISTTVQNPNPANCEDPFEQARQRALNRQS